MLHPGRMVEQNRRRLLLTLTLLLLCLALVLAVVVVRKLQEPTAALRQQQRNDLALARDVRGGRAGTQPPANPAR
jgi:hypothetical protein